ncbi:hypothetical protein AVDCRST_MAG94-3770 [uncultured Leptolyngbya sp.]|uniref:Uncharacterized protein n=1 Tax=uncultured Leptolyngbya sp. TaxID=332963 RepID=A0A6J4MRH4_9CYAN|nr:hypothetical protein AVDCRST_MAG94-3770 [uncultured Leptolyngbya sp.]
MKNYPFFEDDLGTLRAARQTKLPVSSFKKMFSAWLSQKKELFELSFAHQELISGSPLIIKRG